jgi:hypothetical protein
VVDGTLALAEATLEVLVTVVGLFVAYQAYRGYRRNDSDPMLFLAAGIGLMVCLHFGIRYPLNWVGVGGQLREFLIQVVDVVVLGLVGYALLRP